jgi:tRNA dimethylallyltransferase
MDIGTDKVSREVQQEIPHHMIDIYPISRSFSAGEFAQQSISSIRDIARRGKVPIVVGLLLVFLQC